MKTGFLLLLLLGLTPPVLAESSPAQPPALHALSPEAEKRLAEASRAATQDKDNQPVLDLLEEDDPCLVEAVGVLLAEHLKPEDLALVVRRAMKEAFPQRHVLLPVLVIAPSVPGTNFLVNQLGAAEDPSQQKMIRNLLVGITGQNFHTTAEWTAWWDKACATFAPEPWDPDRAGEKIKTLAERLKLDAVDATLKEFPSAKTPGSLAAQDMIRNLIGLSSAGLKAVEDAPRAPDVMNALASFRQGDFGEADAALSRHLDQSPRDVYALFLRAAARINQGNHAAVQDDLTLLLRLDPSTTSARLLLELNRIMANQPQSPLVEAYWQAWHLVRPEKGVLCLSDPILQRFQAERRLDLPTYQHPGGEAVRRHLTEHASDPALATGFALLLPKDEMRPALDDVLARHPNHAGAKNARLERLLELHSGNSTALLEEARKLLVEDPDNLLLQLCVVDQEGKHSLPERVWSREDRSPMPSNTWTRLVAVAEGKGRWPTRSKALLDLQRQAAQQAGWVFLEISGPEFLNSRIGLFTLFRRAMATVRTGCPQREAMAVAALAERVADGIRTDRNDLISALVVEAYLSIAVEMKRLVAEQSKNEGEVSRLAKVKADSTAKRKPFEAAALELPQENEMPVLALQQAYRDFRLTRDPIAAVKAHEEFRQALPKP